MKIELHEEDFDALKEATTLHWLIKTPLRILIAISCLFCVLNMPSEDNILLTIIYGVWWFGNIILVLLEYPYLSGGSYTCAPNGLSFWILFHLQSGKVKEAYRYASFILYADKTIIEQREKKHADLLFMYLAIGHRKYINAPFSEWRPYHTIYTMEQIKQILEEYEKRNISEINRRIKDYKQLGFFKSEEEAEKQQAQDTKAFIQSLKNKKRYFGY